MSIFESSIGWHLLGVILQWVVVVIDADAEKQRTQALHQPFILSQVLWDLCCQLRETPSQGLNQQAVAVRLPPHILTQRWNIIIIIVFILIHRVVFFGTFHAEYSQKVAIFRKSSSAKKWDNSLLTTDYTDIYSNDIIVELLQGYKGNVFLIV